MNEPRILYLTESDSRRLAAWLALFEIAPEGINPRRYERMRKGTRWLDFDELAILTDSFPPYDGAGVIRGAVTLSTIEEIPL